MIPGISSKFDKAVRQFAGKVELCGSSTTRPSRNIFKSSAKDSSMAKVNYTVGEDKSITIQGEANRTATSTCVILGAAPGATHGQLASEIGFTPGKTYTFSLGTLTTPNIAVQLYMYDENGTSLKVATVNNVQPKSTFTAPEGVYRVYSYIAVYVGADVVKPVVLYPQLEEGSTPTEYEPYGEIFVPLDGETFSHDGDLMDFEIEKTGEGKFFGYGVGQKITVKVRDKDGVYNPSQGQIMRPFIDGISIGPEFYVKDIKRDENTNQLTLIGYDALEKATGYQLSDLEEPYTNYAELIRSIGAILNFSDTIHDQGMFENAFTDNMNANGSETLREILDDIAEATQTIYYLNYNNAIVFKELRSDMMPNYTVGKSQYFTLKSEPARRLAAIVSMNELGDNAGWSNGDGETQYVRDNVFWTLNADLRNVIETAVAKVAGLTIVPYDCSWRGNYLVEIGDRLMIDGKDGSFQTFLINDKLTFNGGLKQKSSFVYEAEEKTAHNPTSLGEALKQTYAKVDKANKQIEMVVSDVSEAQSAISSLQMNEKSITATVEGLQKTAETTTGEIETLTQKVSTQITQDQVSFAITTELAKGVDKVATKEKNYTFDDEGLSISSSDSEISTTITENGMTVKKGGEDVLIANKDGVLAEDLKATTFLIIAGSRFENYGGRTGCFWIGG